MLTITLWTLAFIYTAVSLWFVWTTLRDDANYMGKITLGEVIGTVLVSFAMPLVLIIGTVQLLNQVPGLGVVVWRKK